MQMNNAQGFSLLELSIVLVIIGLITGGIMAGQSMVRAAELRSVMSDFNKYQSAINTFREKYNGYPGDLKNATSYWGVAAAGATCVTTAGTGTQTCDGDGNGNIVISTNSNEPYRAWQQLASAGLVEGQYTGITNGSTTYSATSGVNIPRAKVAGSGYAFFYSASYPGDAWTFATQYGNSLIFGGDGANNYPATANLTAAELYSIDQKLDDGKPGTGIVIARNWDTCSTATSFSDLNAAAYDLATSGNICATYYKLGF